MADLVERVSKAPEDGFEEEGEENVIWTAISKFEAIADFAGSQFSRQVSS